MATLVEADRRLSNVSLDERDLSGSERIFHGVTHKPQLFAFLCNKRYANLNNLLPPVELKASREQLVYVILVLLAFYLLFGCFAELICNVFGFAYPAYASVKAIRTPNKEDDTQWLMYWTVFATFSIVDSMVSVITNSLPIYWLLKAAFLLYLYVPNSNGTQMLFYNIVNPIISVIDDFINSSYQSKRFNEFKNNHRYRLI
ncbi:TB2/DP1 protein [Loa loa]|uniref:Receptor expression-enhancing protein n=1 Tax=Loa loa TaxID=7209 RepID=A0A1S0TMI7_LOALO|nr:TB2/DP1 protein [Loa loa]EFO16490.2 TB2/DP1 protein [Loa loa]